MEIIHFHYQVNNNYFNKNLVRIFSFLVGADLGILLNLIHRNLKERSRLAIAQKDYKPNRKLIKQEKKKKQTNQRSKQATFSSPVGLLAFSRGLK